MKNDIQEILLSAEEISSICQKLGQQIEEDYRGKKPILVGLLRGCMPFMADLAKCIHSYVYLDYMSVSSYEGTSSTGVIKINKDVSMDVSGKDVIVIDDIIDTGHTLKYITKYFMDKGASSVKTCCLLDKPEGRKVDINADYVGHIIPNEFAVGYGLDYDGLYRNLDIVGVLKPEVYSK